MEKVYHVKCEQCGYKIIDQAIAHNVKWFYDGKASRKDIKIVELDRFDFNIRLTMHPDHKSKGHTVIVNYEPSQYKDVA